MPAGTLLNPDYDPGELTEPNGTGSDPADAALAHDEHNRRVRAFQALKRREREALWRATVCASSPTGFPETIGKASIG